MRPPLSFKSIKKILGLNPKRLIVCLVLNPFITFNAKALPFEQAKSAITKLKETYTLTQDEDEVLQTHTNIVKTLHAMNASFISLLESCYRTVHSEELKEYKLPGHGQSELQPESFIQFKFINLKGSLASKTFDCKTAVEKYIDRRLPKDLKDMRLYLALAKPRQDLFGDHWLYYTEQFLKNKLSINNQMNPHPAHLIKSSETLDLTENLEPLTPVEYLEAQNRLQILRSGICQKFILENHLENKVSPFELGDGKLTCDELIPELEKGQIKIPGTHSTYRVFLEFAFRSLINFRKEALRLYLEKLNNNRLVLFLKRSAYTHLEVLRALDRIRINSQNEVKKETKLSAYQFFKEQWALVNTQNILKQKYPEKSKDDAIKSLLEKGEKQKKIADGIDLGILTGSFFICFTLPVGWEANILRLSLGRSTCQLGMAIGVDATYLASTYLSEISNVQAFLISLTSELKSTSSEELLSLKMQEKMATFFLLAGIFSAL